MTVIMVFALRTHTDKITNIQTAGVGVGMHEMGNKGAVAVRLHYTVTEDNDDTAPPLELTAIAAHLAPMEDGLSRRNEDWASIVRGLVFTPTSSKTLQQHRQNTSSSSSSEAATESSALLSWKPSTAGEFKLKRRLLLPPGKASTHLRRICS